MQSEPERTMPHWVANNMELSMLRAAFSEVPQIKAYTPVEATRRIDSIERLLRAICDRLAEIDGKRFYEQACSSGTRIITHEHDRGAKGPEAGQGCPICFRGKLVTDTNQPELLRCTVCNETIIPA